MLIINEVKFMSTLHWILVIAGGALLLFFLIYLFLLAPSLNKKRRAEMRSFCNVRYAHRGLHDATRAENSMSAFKAALDAGYGMELDVRLSSDGELVVFHDATLDRVTDATGRVDSYTYAELSKIHLSGTEDTVPAFRDLLKLVDGKVPLIVEIKEEAGSVAVTEKTAELLREYKGAYVVESFNPLAIAHMKKIMPEVLRGQLSETYTKNKKFRDILHVLLQCLVFNVSTRPDFIAFNIRDRKNAALRLCRGIFGACTVAWTVRSREEEAIARKSGFDAVIFENYIPEGEK